MKPNKSKIGITGASGLLGTRIIKLFLEKGYFIHALYRSQKSIESDQVRWIQGDILDISQLELFVKECDIIIHCAAIVSFHKKNKNLLFETNVQGTENIVNLMVEYPNKKLIQISSVAALGRKPDVLLNEESEWNSDLTHSLYGKSKMLGEMVVYRGIAEGANAMILVPSLILAHAEDHRSSADLWSQIRHLSTWAPSGGNGFVDANDVAKAIYAVLRNWKKGEKIIVSGHNLSYSKIYALYTKKAERSIKKLNRKLLKILLPLLKVYYFFIGKKSSVSRASIDTSSNTYLYDNSKSLSLLNMRYTPIEETIERIRSNY